MPDATPQERVQQRIVWQSVHVPVPQVVEGNRGSGPDRSQERIPKRITDRVVGAPVVKQRLVPMIRTVQRTVDVPQVQFLVCSGRRAWFDARRRQSSCTGPVHRHGGRRSRADGETSFAVQVCKEEAAEVSQFQFSNREWWIPVVQQRTDATGAVLKRIADVRVVAQRRIQEKIEFSHVQHLDKMVDVPVAQVHRSTSWKSRLRPQSQIVQQHVEVPEIQTSESLKSTHVRQVAPTELKRMVQKVEMDVAMLTADIDKRADVDKCRQSVDDELSDARRETVSDGERDRVKSYISESRAGGARSSSVCAWVSPNIVSTMTVSHIDLNKRAGEPSNHR